MWFAREPAARPALTTGDHLVTYREVADGVDQRCHRLRTLDDAIVSLPASMTAGFVMTLLALLELRRPVAVCSPAWTADERASRLALLGAHVEVDADAEVVRHQPGRRAALHPLTRLILFTTGSTGHPKAVQLSEDNIRANTRAVIEALAFRRTDAQTLFLPLSYSFGLLGHLLPGLELGIRTDLVDRLIDVAARFLENTVRGMVSGVPSHFETILRMLPPGFECDHVSHVVTAGAYSPPELRRRLRAAFPTATIYNNYGQTEASPRILCFSSSHPLFYTPATGYPVGDLRVRLSENGELLVSGSQVMLGYLGDDEATRRKVTGGWLATGDLATIADDGLVTVTGRLDELVNVGGERTSTREVEAALRRLAGVRDAAVLAVPDALYGSACIAYVEPAAAGLTEHDLIGALRRLVSGHNVPKRLHIVAALPRNQHGKIDRAALAAIHGGT